VGTRGDSIAIPVNLASQGIMGADGAAGPNASSARQWEASGAGAYSIHPTKTAPYSELPPLNLVGIPTHAPFARASAARAIGPGLPQESYDLLTSAEAGCQAPASLVLAYGRPLFFENANGSPATLSSRSRDNLPNPVADPQQPYVLRNSRRSEISSRCLAVEDDIQPRARRARREKAEPQRTQRAS